MVITRAGERFRLEPDLETGCNPAAICQRWAEIQAFLDQYPGTHLLRQHLTDPIEIVTEPLDAEQARQPLLCPIDRWGHLPHAQPMTPQSVSTLVRAHLSGRAPLRKTLTVDAPDVAEVWVEPEIALDPTYYERGTAARHRDHESLDGLVGIYDKLEQQADALLDKLMEMLEGV